MNEDDRLGLSPWVTSWIWIIWLLAKLEALATFLSFYFGKPLYECSNRGVFFGWAADLQYGTPGLCPRSSTVPYLHSWYGIATILEDLRQTCICTVSCGMQLSIFTSVKVYYHLWTCPTTRVGSPSSSCGTAFRPGNSLQLFYEVFYPISKAISKAHQRFCHAE